MAKELLIKFIIHFQGDLGTITDKYDVAISTACGALDNVVVDNMETAVKCVQFLKENNVGTATFIGLEKVHVNICMYITIHVHVFVCMYVIIM